MIRRKFGSAPGLPRPAPALVVALFATASVWLLAQQPPAPRQEESAMNAFGRLIPEGFVNKDVRIPSFDAGGRPSSLLTAATLQRVDEDRLYAEKVHIEVYSDEPAGTMTVDLISATHNMKDQILRSGERSVITRSDFIAEGDSLVFDAKTSIGSLRGRVRTIIFDTSASADETDGDAAATPAAPAPAPAR